ncbi:MAG: RNA polymerase-binding protein DksA [Alphaproteobacteria bacterium]
MDLPTVPPGYSPSNDEEYMCPLHLAFFRKELQKWKQSLIDQADETLRTLANESMQSAESTDRASFETNKAFELRTRDRSRKLIKKIDQAIRRIDLGEYGYCEETGEPIGLGRLKARPSATLCIEAQEAHEKDERMTRAA